MKRRVEGDGEKRGSSETENIERADREEMAVVLRHRVEVEKQEHSHIQSLGRRPETCA